MANTTVAVGNRVQQWSLKYFREYIRQERFARYTGESPNNVFHVCKDLTKKAGDNITIALITRLSGAGVTGDTTLEGSEEALGNFDDNIAIDQLRNAVSRGEHEQSKTVIDLLDAARHMLKRWSMEKLRDLKIDRMQSANLNGTTLYAGDTEVNKDAWLLANQGDRVLFGSLNSNLVSGDNSASLLTVDTANDTLDRGIIGALRRKAENADTHITPISVGEDEEWFVMFVGSNPYRDLKSDMDTVHQNAGPRSMSDNPIWRDGDLVYENVIVRKIPEMASIGNVGNLSAPVYVAALCGAQAVGLAWGKLTRAIRNNGSIGTDYGNIFGVGICETRGAKKLFYNSLQHGMVTGFVASAADA